MKKVKIEGGACFTIGSVLVDTNYMFVVRGISSCGIIDSAELIMNTNTSSFVPAKKDLLRGKMTQSHKICGVRIEWESNNITKQKVEILSENG